MGIIAVDAPFGVACVDEEGSVGALLIVDTKIFSPDPQRTWL